MVSNSKILTVSYGTFSCTLEGFDDSFNTMKAIAEYFRDLAADDRYFGAEPPSPDAEMLARIAEREISRRVEAHGTNGAYHLKAGPSALTAEPAAAAPAPKAEAAPQPAPAAAEPAFAKPDAEDMPDEAAFMPAPTARASAPAAESIADKLRRIRAVAAPAGTGAPGFDEDEHAQDFLTETPEAEAPSPAEQEQAETVEQAMPEVDDSFEDEDAPAPVDLDSLEEAFEPEADEEDMPAPAEVAEANEAEEKPADAAAADDTEDEAESDADILTRLSQPEVAAEADADMPAESAENDDDPYGIDSFDYASYDDAEDAAEAAEMPEEAEDHAAIEAAADDEDDDNIFGEDDADTSSDDANDTLAQLLADAMTPSEADAADARAKEAVGALDAKTGDEDERPLAARVVKMKRADLDAALAGGEFEEETEEADSASVLSPEAEAELQRELAEVEAELQNARAPDAALDAVRPDADADAAMDDDEKMDASDLDAEELPDDFMSDEFEDEDADNAPAAEEKSARDEAESRGKRLDTPAPDAQAARIFDEADTQLEEPASNERRSAIQHLRAAVAATRAERRAGGAMQADVDDRPYRDDLQTAVRPRRPRPVSTGSTPRPSAAAPQRPAPLKLVAEQRIDTGTAPVRPRRITRADLAPAPEAASREEVKDAPGFAAFAEQMGASNLTEMLEAAAAYMADVEGMPQFSRPMLMQKLREAQDEEFSREDGLRSFGQLLRQGKLQKLKGGRFAITDVTEFRQSA
ncbi:hypothetical protein [Roseovarius aquimarinus]|uniref:Lipoprotein n=1 Tax=Roseovarius aquimarinus TaxID=1229156 RepID=A0ABW7I508_9RHOB